MSMMWIAIGTTVVGTAVSVYGQNQAKKAGRADAQATAQQQYAAAVTSRAVGQRQANEERRQARLLDSALQARAMGGGMDPTAVELSKDIAGEGEYRALSALYEGETGAISMENAAASGLRSAEARGRAADYQMAGTVIGAGSSLYGRYSGNLKSTKG